MDAEKRVPGRIPDGDWMGGGSPLLEDSDSESGLEAGLEKTAAADSEASAAREEGVLKEGDE